MMNNLPPMLCAACGTIAVPRLGAGVGPHVAKAVCTHCGRLLKWLPKVLVQRFSDVKEATMPGGVNRVVLLETIGKYGVDVHYAPSGSPCASFLLVVSEQGQDGKAYPTLIPCECWGKKAEAASELEAGALVLFEGKLAKRKKGEGWELVVSGFEVQPVLAPALGVSGSSN
jgi:primosomal replication protein N